MAIASLQDLINVHLQMLHNMEIQIVAALPLLIENASMSELKEGLSQHLKETQDQVTRIEKIGTNIQLPLNGVTEMPMMYILKAGQELIQQITDPEIKDMAIIGGSEKVEHYEMAAYQGVITLSKKADLNDFGDILEDSLKEEKAAATKLSALTMGTLGKVAAKIL
jgi:ferritin-like metal-binding protein YciE